MRLIDGAELFRQICRTHDEFIGLDELAELIDKMPTIDAIPVEWLKKKYEEADDMGMGIEDWSEKDCFGHVIKEWEKENGTDRQEQTP